MFNLKAERELLNWIIEKYYSVNDLVIRELLAKRHVKSRKDLTEIMDSCLEDEAAGTYANVTRSAEVYVPPITLKSVTRQYDNIRRIQFAYEEHIQQYGSINLVNFLEIHWLMPSLLAKVCVCINIHTLYIIFMYIFHALINNIAICVISLPTGF